MTPILRAEQMCPLFELRFYDKQKKKRKLNKFDWKKVISEKHFLKNVLHYFFHIENTLHTSIFKVWK